MDNGVDNQLQSAMPTKVFLSSFKLDSKKQQASDFNGSRRDKRIVLGDIRDPDDHAGEHGHTEFVTQVVGRTVRGYVDLSFLLMDGGAAFELHPSHFLSENDSPKAKTPLVIPLITRNQWMNPPSVEHPGTSDRKEVAPSSNFIYGLQKTELGVDDIDGQTNGQGATVVVTANVQVEQPAVVPQTLDELAAAHVLADAADTASKPHDSGLILGIPILQQNAVPGLAELTSEEEKYRHDVALRPDEPTFADYDGVPVDQFGTALLRGMGWKDGQAIGKNKKNALIRPIEYVARPALLGLGANPDNLPMPDAHKRKRYIKPGDTRDRTRDYKPVVTEDGRVRHYREVGAPEENRLRVTDSGLRRGDAVVVTVGKHRGRTGEVEDLRGKKGRDTEVSVRMDDSNETKVFYDDELDRWQRASGGCSTQALRDIVDPPVLSRNPKRTSRSVSPGGSRQLSSSRSEHHEQGLNGTTNNVINTATSAHSWIHPHTRVRIISESVGALHYKQKCVVLDTPTPSTATLRTPEGEILEGIPRRVLETIIPAAGHRVMVVGHHGNVGRRWYGQIGRLLEKDKAKERVVMEMEDGEVETFSYDDVCEYVE
ncbi:hypothetical protein HDU93_008189 [Gonapodya sp. JEL0774]|nr:hypothetical protein HDU93_008189 [Gonapodya sp. JEL0774]